MTPAISHMRSPALRKRYKAGKADDVLALMLLTQSVGAFCRNPPNKASRAESRSEAMFNPPPLSECRISERRSQPSRWLTLLNGLHKRHRTSGQHRALFTPQPLPGAIVVMLDSEEIREAVREFLELLLLVVDREEGYELIERMGIEFSAEDQRHEIIVAARGIVEGAIEDRERRRRAAQRAVETKRRRRR
jgi:hypothetical protein